MSRSAKLRYLIPALVALATVIYGVVVSSVNTRNNLRDAERVAHSRAVLVSLQDTLRYMLDLETGSRGFVIVGEPQYLAPYEAALKKVDLEIGRLTELTRDNPSQQVRIGSIREVSELCKRSIANYIETRRTQGLEAAVTLVQHGGGKEQMDRLRTLVDDMRADELILFERREERLAKSLRRTNLTVAVSGMVAIAAGAIGTTLLLMFLAAQDRAEALRVQKEKAEGADRAKSDFLAMMSHEIRTPMNAILGFGELLHDRVKTPQEKHFAGAILSSGTSLLSLINDILDLSKIEAGKIDLQPETVAMSKFAENLETLFSFRAAEKGLVYAVRVTPSVPSLLSFDALRLRQVLVNLAGNALKFCQAGSVIVTMRADEATTNDMVMLHIEVADTGIGISEELLTDIFRPFYQIDSRQGRQFQGTGLGLSISKRLVDVMQGELKVESELGKGSIFTVSVPTVLRQRQDEPSEETDNQPVDFSLLKPSKIVIADDEPLNRELIRTYLAGSGHQLFEAENGEQAVAISLQERPDLVLMDIRMPNMDGKAALEKIRSREEIRHVPVIAITASSLLNSQKELKTIFDGYADKPLSRAKLFIELSRFLPTVAAPAPVPDYIVTFAPPGGVGRSWPELCEYLDELHRSIWPDLVKLVPAQGTMRFAARLTELADQHSCPLLAEFSTRLTNAAETMEFSEAGRMLQSFPSLISQLRTSQ